VTRKEFLAGGVVAIQRRDNAFVAAPVRKTFAGLERMIELAKVIDVAPRTGAIFVYASGMRSFVLAASGKRERESKTS
jgi:hypothetical protein